LTALGWSSTVRNNDPKSQPDVLRGVNLFVGDVEGCKTIDSNYESSDGPLICTLNKYNSGNATCAGNAGTAVVVTANNSSYLAGIASE
ncbi:hypothetical protein GGI21_004734, partial [Coemansia aciculifera]